MGGSGWVGEILGWALICIYIYIYNIKKNDENKDWLTMIWVKKTKQNKEKHMNRECCLPSQVLPASKPVRWYLDTEKLKEWPWNIEYSTEPQMLHRVRSLFILCIHTLHYITLHCTTLHYITLHCIALQCITLHWSTLHYIALHYIDMTWHDITLHYITFITLHYTTLHYITLHYTTLHYTT